ERQLPRFARRGIGRLGVCPIRSLVRRALHPADERHDRDRGKETKRQSRELRGVEHATSKSCAPRAMGNSSVTRVYSSRNLLALMPCLRSHRYTCARCFFLMRAIEATLPSCCSRSAISSSFVGSS